MSETAVATARAQVMVYDDAIKKWVPSGSTGTQGIAKVQLFQHIENNTFRVVGRKVQDHEVVLNCSIVRGLKYNQATPTFHQWRDQRQVYGLNFTTAEDAANFSALMLQALDFLASSPDHGNHLLTNGVGGGHSASELNGGYQQQAGNSPHHVHSTPNFRQQSNGNGQYYDDDPHDGIIPTSAAAAQQANFRKSSQPQNHQRRSSQGSCGSSGSTPSTNNLIYATGPSPSRPAPPAPPPPPGPLNGGRPAPTSTSAPPPPAPPPPPSALRNGGPAEKPGGLAEQIKAAQLRKTSAPLSTSDANGAMSIARESRTPSIGSAENGSAPRNVANGGGGGGLMSELAATINRRKNLAESKPVDDTDSNGGGKQASEPAIRRPWEARNGNGVVNGNGNGAVVESPKTHRNFVRRVPSGSSLSSQEEQNRTATANGPTSPSTLSAEALDRWKQELLNEVRGEIAKAKNEIIEAVRAELRR